MYINRKGYGYYTASGQQGHTRAPFMLLLQTREDLNAGRMRAIVRTVALRQLGHWMMGRANVGGRWVTVSGSYGSDGLPMHVDGYPKDAIPVPDELYQAWAKGDGWNGAGNEAPAMRQWANEQFKL
jgi:hypothetical protein